MIQRLIELREIINSAREEVNKIQNECKHDNFSEGVVESWKNLAVCNVCDDCEKILDYIRPYKLYTNSNPLNIKIKYFPIKSINDKTPE